MISQQQAKKLPLKVVFVISEDNSSVQMSGAVSIERAALLLLKIKQVEKKLLEIGESQTETIEHNEKVEGGE